MSRDEQIDEKQVQRETEADGFRGMVGAISDDREATENFKKKMDEVKRKDWKGYCQKRRYLEGRSE